MKPNLRISMVTLWVLFSGCSTQAIDVGSTVVDAGEPTSTGGTVTASGGAGGSILLGVGGTAGILSPGGTGGGSLVGSGGVPGSGGLLIGAGGTPGSGGLVIAAGAAPGGSGGGVGGFAGTGGGLVSPSCTDHVVATSANNYTASTNLSFPIIKAKPKSDLLFDWAGATADFTGHAMNPSVDIRSVALLAFALTPEETQAAINNDTLSMRDLTVVPASLVTGGRTSAHLSDLTLNGQPVPLDVYIQYFDPDFYPPARTTYVFVVQSGTEVLRDVKLYQFFQLDPASTNTLVPVTPASTQMTAMVDLHSLTPAQIPTGKATGSLDFGGLARTGEGSIFIPDRVTAAFIGHYVESPAELEAKLFDLDQAAIELYRAVIPSGNVLDFSTLISGIGEVFPGITSTGTWLLGLQCGACHDPTPQYLTVLAPCPTLLGVACDLGPGVTPSPSVASYNDATPECGTGLCVKPAVAATVSTAVDTAPYCTWACTQDSDCSGGAVRGSDPGTKSCVSGYACGIAFVKGKQCCRNLCLCRDFTGPGPIETPIACQGAAAATCDQ